MAISHHEHWENMKTNILGRVESIKKISSGVEVVAIKNILYVQRKKENRKNLTTLFYCCCQ